MATSRRALIVALPMMAAALFSARTAFAAGPQVLSPMDERAYREAFAAAQRGDFEDAEGALTKVKDRSLAGHLAFQKLMHPTAWSATYEELTGWLKHYGDHPGAERLITIAALIVGFSRLEQILFMLRGGEDLEAPHGFVALPSDRSA